MEWSPLRKLRKIWEALFGYRYDIIDVKSKGQSWVDITSLISPVQYDYVWKHLYIVSIYAVLKTGAVGVLGGSLLWENKVPRLHTHDTLYLIISKFLSFKK